MEQNQSRIESDTRPSALYSKIANLTKKAKHDALLFDMKKNNVVTRLGLSEQFLYHDPKNDVGACIEASAIVSKKIVSSQTTDHPISIKVYDAYKDSLLYMTRKNRAPHHGRAKKTLQNNDPRAIALDINQAIQVRNEKDNTNLQLPKALQPFLPEKKVGFTVPKFQSYHYN